MPALFGAGDMFHGFVLQPSLKSEEPESLQLNHAGSLCTGQRAWHTGIHLPLLPEWWD